MLRLTDTVKHLIAINVVVFLIVHFLLPNFMTMSTIRDVFVMHSPDTGRFEPYQIVTSFFNHADFRHLLFNMLGLAFLGPMVEASLGPKRFLLMYLAAGVLSCLPAFFIPSYASLGASGAVYAVIVAFAAMFPNMQLMLIFPPIPVRAKYLVAFIIGYDLLFGISGADTGVGHFAHLMGALVGFLCIVYWGKLNLR